MFDPEGNVITIVFTFVKVSTKVAENFNDTLLFTYIFVTGVIENALKGLGCKLDIVVLHASIG